MDRIIFSGIKQQNLVSPSQPYFLPQPPPTSVPQVNLQTSGSNVNNKVSPSILLIIIMLAIIFFISGLLHLLVRLLLRPHARDPEDLDNVTALQGQLQQLFHLHDAGVDQSFIDTLPVFNYKAIIGLKDPFDCAVCLCEFEPEDKLRLLPKCSHAFHMECIDTWLLSHSTCPLCRASLLPDFPQNSCSSPMVLVLESGGSESSREIVAPDRDGGALCTTNSVSRTNSHLGFHCRDESCEIQAKDDQSQPAMVMGPEEKVVTVKLGKFRNMDSGGGDTSSSSIIGSCNNDVDARRCFSMGSFAYVMDEKSYLQVPIRTPMKKQSSKKASLPLTSGHRPAMSECDCDSRREFNGFETFRSVGIHGIGNSGRSVSNENGNAIDGSSKRESFSISKIWLRAKKEKPNPPAVAEESSRRAFSFRFPGHRNDVAGEELKTKNGSCRRTISEIDIGRWENWGGSELGCDEENQSCSSLDYQAKTPSFARKTLLWLVGGQNKVVHSSFSTNI